MTKILLIFLFAGVGLGIYFVVYNGASFGDNGSESRQQTGSGLGGEVNIKQMVLTNSTKPITKPVSNSATHLFTVAESKLKSGLNNKDHTIQLDEGNNQSKVETSQAIPLWEPKISDAPALEQTIEHEELIHTDPKALANLQVGQVLEFFVPQLGETFQSQIESTSNQLGNVKVWKGNIEGQEQNKSNFIMTQGEVMTNVVLATAEGVYTVHINNKTGEGTIIDDREYSSRISSTDDAVPFSQESPTE